MKHTNYGLLLLFFAFANSFFGTMRAFAADQDDALEAFSAFVGKWKLEGSDRVTICKKTPGGKFTFERDGEPIILIGWDATSKTLKIFSFTQDSGQAYVDEITVTGKGPTFRSERVYGPKDDDYPLTIKLKDGKRFDTISKNGETVVAGDRIPD